MMGPVCPSDPFQGKISRTRIGEYDTEVAEYPGRPEKLLILIPGCPGMILFYDEFL